MSFYIVIRNEMKSFFIAAGKSLYQATAALVTLVVSDNIVQFTNSPYYSLSLLAIGIPTVVTMIYARDKSWRVEFRKMVNQASAWVLGVIAFVMLGFPERLLTLVSPGFSPDNAIVLFSVFLLMLLPAILFNMADSFKDVGTRIGADVGTHDPVKTQDEAPSNGSRRNQETRLNIIDMVDSEFKGWRVLTLWVWAAAVFSPAILAALLAIILGNDISSHPGTITTADTALLALIVAMLSLVITMLSNIITKESMSWTIEANFKRLAKKDPNPILYGLVSMKARAPKVKIRDAYNLSPELFTTESLLKRVYREGEP